jgi:outer membrane protein assembly factor BamB
VGPSVGQFATLRYRLAWKVGLQANADSTPVVEDIPLPTGGIQTMAFVLAGNNRFNCGTSHPVRTATMYAFDFATGRLIWKMSTTGSPSA